MTVSDWPVPTAGQQLEFMKNIQRLLYEGGFVATYKYALLHALADLSIVKGDDTGAPLSLTTDEIASRFIELYWQQARPFQAGDACSGVILKQNTGRQASVITMIADAHAAAGGSLYRQRQETPRWRALVKAVAQTIRTMPLWRLQTVGSERLDFLYKNEDAGEAIMLEPGVPYCFRVFHAVLCGLFRSAWAEYLRGNNRQELGSASDLQEFLFGQERAALQQFVPILRDLQSNQCFYCQRRLAESSAVDHFIPWSRCRSDLAHNFVLAHGHCNAAKSDYLAFERHLEAWCARNADQRAEMIQRFDAASMLHDLPASLSVARWAYGQTEGANGQVWVEGKVFCHLGGTWRSVFAA
jgi:hypothetical protein